MVERLLWWVCGLGLDVTDKALLFELGRNCRQSYQVLGRKLGLTVNAVKKRVNKLLDAGIILRFLVSLVGQRYGIVPLFILLRTDGAEDKEAFIQQLGDTRLLPEVATLVDGRYILLGQVSQPEDMLRLERLLRGVACIREVEIRQIAFVMPSKPKAPQTPFYASGPPIQGGTLTFTKLQQQVLRCLVDDPRMPVTEIARRTKLSPKRVRAVSKELEADGNVYFGMREVLGAGEDFDCHIRIEFDYRKGELVEVVDWFKERYPLEHWWSFRFVDEPVLFNKLLVGDLRTVETIADAVKQIPIVQSVQTLIYHTKRIFPLVGETRLRQMLDMPSS